MSCYCANYYGSINCQNMVLKFGDQCSSCLVSTSPFSFSKDSNMED
ncbi:hypothetical protein BofuT4_uP076940.1 [Botrytis cinerea T4]|uniref:Uncharacterized protein n=1 Tax=Botryotinia fuckeliana (strain T4) TaxID=999810 RepID=G2XP05_BOTF4|nr:hypothetical protein BofuT4_uP076940.1 [Botrytis cinerea T4]